MAEVARLFGSAEHYTTTYDRPGLLGERSVLAHNVHACDAELDLLAGAGVRAVAHCPTSNSALGSGLFPITRHVDHGVPSRSAPTSAPAPASRCSRRGCRRTSCSVCSAPTACR